MLPPAQVHQHIVTSIMTGLCGKKQRACMHMWRGRPNKHQCNHMRHERANPGAPNMHKRTQPCTVASDNSDTTTHQQPRPPPPALNASTASRLTPIVLSTRPCSSSSTSVALLEVAVVVECRLELLGVHHLAHSLVVGGGSGACVFWHGGEGQTVQGSTQHGLESQCVQRCCKR